MHAYRGFVDVQKAMQQAYNLAQDYAWNGEQKAYERMMARYKHYKELYDKGELWEPNF